MLLRRIFRRFHASPAAMSPSAWVVHLLTALCPEGAPCSLPLALDEASAPPPVEACIERLTEMGAVVTPATLTPYTNQSGLPCGTPQAVRVSRLPLGTKIPGSPILSCQMALGMAALEPIIQEEAQASLGRSVVALRHRGSFSCREIKAYPGWVSQHSFANALDISAFILKGGKEVKVKGEYGKDEQAPGTKRGTFLRNVAHRAYDEGIFTVVLTPRFDRAHHDHFHFDMAPYTVDGSR